MWIFAKTFRSFLVIYSKEYAVSLRRRPSYSFAFFDRGKVGRFDKIVSFGLPRNLLNYYPELWPSKTCKIVVTKEEEASIVKYCNDNGVNYKARLSELGVPEPTLTKLLRLVAKSRQIATNQNKIATRTSPEACVFSPYFADTYGGKESSNNVPSS